MDSKNNYPILLLPEDFDERSESAMIEKGWYPAKILLGDNLVVELIFYDPFRLKQEIDSSFEIGEEYFAEPNIIVIKEVNVESIKLVINKLWENKYFSLLKV